MMNWRRSVVVHRVPYKQIFAARRCSWAWLVSTLLWILALGVPFILAFCVNGWWFTKNPTTRTTAEKPRLLAVQPTYASLSLTSVESRKPTAPTSRIAKKDTFKESSEGAQPHPSGSQQQLRGQHEISPENEERGPLILLGKLEWTPPSPAPRLTWSPERQAFVKNGVNEAGKKNRANPKINASVGASGDSIRVDLDWPLILNGEKNLHTSQPDKNDVNPKKVTQCEVGLRIFYELPSAPDVVLDGLVVVSAQTAVPASGLLLRGNLLLRQATAGDLTAQDPLHRRNPKNIPTLRGPFHKDNAETMDSDTVEAMAFSALTTRARWSQGSNKSNDQGANGADRFVGTAVLNTTFSTVAKKPSSFEKAIEAWTRYFVIALPFITVPQNNKRDKALVRPERTRRIGEVKDDAQQNCRPSQQNAGQRKQDQHSIIIAVDKSQKRDAGDSFQRQRVEPDSSPQYVRVCKHTAAANFCEKPLPQHQISTGTSSYLFATARARHRRTLTNCELRLPQVPIRRHRRRPQPDPA